MCEVRVRVVSQYSPAAAAYAVYGLRKGHSKDGNKMWSLPSHHRTTGSAYLFVSSIRDLCFVFLNGARWWNAVNTADRQKEGHRVRTRPPDRNWAQQCIAVNTKGRQKEIPTSCSGRSLRWRFASIVWLVAYFPKPPILILVWNHLFERR